MVLVCIKKINKEVLGLVICHTRDKMLDSVCGQHVSTQ